MNDTFLVDFKNLDFKVPSTIKRANKDTTPLEPVHILKDISGSFKPKRLTCLMGPSGSGKTTLLNLIAGRQNASSVPGSKSSGTISLNNTPIDPTTERERFAYVMAHDALFPTMSPRETFRFALKLGSKDTMTDEEIEEKIESLLRNLRLTSCGDTMVGNLSIKGLSSGEKKRVSVGMELIHDPELLLLDEPTSGLDSHSALLLVELLKQLALSGRTVVSSIHQPSSEVFQKFDDACFMANGEVIYFGPVSEVLPYFAKKGHVCPADSNPSDFIMYLLQTLSGEELKNLADQQRKEVSDGKPSSTSSGEGETTAREVVAVPGSHAKRKQRSFGVQFWELGKREWLNFFRDVGALKARLNVGVVIILIISFVFWMVGDNSTQSEIDISHQGAVTLLAVNAMFSNSQILLLSFPIERPVFLREYSSGMYSVPAYFFSKSVVEFPVLFAQVALSTVIAYYLMAFQGSYIGLVYALFLVSIASASVALLLSSIANDARRAMELTPLIFVPQIFFSGFFVPMTSVPAVLRWGQYLCALKYALNIVYISEFSGFACAESQIFSPNNINTDLEWLYAIILVVITLGFRVLALIALKLKAHQLY